MRKSMSVAKGVPDMAPTARVRVPTEGGCGPLEQAPLISFRDAALGYGHQIVLRDVTLDFREGDFLGIVGPNGSGKTTLIKTALGLLRPLGGTVTVMAGGGGAPRRVRPPAGTGASPCPPRARRT